ncbi:hypothetical protein DXG01_003890 [Tephrocybe rancida]|nr:hypothetical protein DXG01_003890 [Tephrocybe rancida]
MVQQQSGYREASGSKAKLPTETRQAGPGRRSSQAMVQPPAAKPTLQVPDGVSGDLYTYNSLNSFSFGSAEPQQASSSRPVHPLSSNQGDADSIGDEFRLGPSDITPRPSVIAYAQINQQPDDSVQQREQTKESRSVQSPNRSRDRRGDNRGRPMRDSNDTSRTGTSSASASATSLSSTGGNYSRSGSRASHTSSSTNQTSAEQSSITDSDDGNDHRHPFAPHAANTVSRGPTSIGTGSASNTAVEFSSDEEFVDSEYDYDYYDEEGVNIEIGSAQYEGSVVTHDWDRDFLAGGGNSSGSIRSGLVYSERRGSNPIAIPRTPPVEDSVFTGRNREDSMATLRRPSRSLDDDFVKLGLIRTGSGQVIVGHPQASPVSVPSSDGDWRVLQERSRNRELTRDAERDTLPSSPNDTRSLSSNITSAAPGPTSDDFGLEWAQMQRGIIGLDPSAFGDIVGNPAPTPSPIDRRPSGTSVGGARWLLSWTRDTRRPSAATVSSYGGDTFGKAIRDWDGPSYQAQRRDWSFKKEKGEDPEPPTISGGKSSSAGILSPRGSMTTEGSPTSSSVTHVDDKTVDKEKGFASTVWKGMRPNTLEFWSNDRVGRFRVDRRAQRATDESKGPQQRLLIHPVKYPNGGGLPPDGPPVTIHKHSKAVAFSISRHYRIPRRRGDIRPTSSRPTDSTLSTLTAGPTLHPLPATKRGSSMILLAPRRVQEAYTSTNTTRKLEAHGLLDDPAAGHSQEATDEKRRRYREREMQKRAQRDRKELEQKTGVVEVKGKGKAHQQGKDDIDVSNASGSLVHTLSPPPTSAPSMHTYPPGFASSSTALVIREANVPEHPISRNSSRHLRRRRRVRDPLEDDIDGEDDEDENAPPTRTPHSEAFGTMDASLIEQLRQERFHNGDSERGGLWNRLVGRANHSVTGSPAQLHAPFVPPWLALQPRNKQESHQGVIDKLDTSFKDVGLLPSNYSTARHGVPTSQRQKKIASSHSNDDPFKQIPDDCLYMLLPLWPGDTDTRSEVLSASFVRPIIHNGQRQYLLVYYKPPPEDEVKKAERSKKRSRSSPTSSYDSNTKRDDRAAILLTAFHITARLVPYQKLQGTGVRVPDEGLTVTGPLETAFAHMPPLADVSENYYEYILGICHSRDVGIEFYPDGLVKMGLCEQSQVIITVPASEEDPFPEPEVTLTPIGRAVLEMVWSGALALTSFGTNS